jgi:Tfp pilus assembly protein PilO
MRLLLSAVALVAIVAIAWFLLISPVRQNIADTESQISEQQNQLHQAQTKLAAAQTTRAEGKKNQARLLELAKMVPLATQVPSLLVQIQDLADQSGIVFTSVTPGAATQAGQFEISSLQLQFSVSYFDLSDFAYRVEQLVAGPGRLLAVKSVQLKLGGAADGSKTASGGSPVLTVDMTLDAFAMTTIAKGSPATGAQPGTTAAGSTSTAGTGTTSTKKATSN